MQDVRPGGTVEVLEYLHRTLDTHFHQLHSVRSRLKGEPPPVYALEHDLSDSELELLSLTVRSAVDQGFGVRARAWWLPFVVYAAESGYGYVGDEYWQSFELSTPSWRAFGDRNRIRNWFKKFATDYGGAVPKGAFAESFPIIAWPITHAVMPRYLQRNLAQLLFEFSNGLTSRLLDSPPELGARLASRSGSYTERFRVFCENTTLLGQVSAALLSGDDEPSPYLLPSTLRRIVEGLSEEREAREWLRHAQRSANRVRGFQPPAGLASTVVKPKAQPRATDPRLFLMHREGWNAYAELPDLTPLCEGLPDVYSQLRVSRGKVNGADRAVPRGGLLHASQQIQFIRWPSSDQPFLQLEQGDEKANRILADQCVITPGPWWLFRRHTDGLAVEIKGKFVRPGHRYVMVGTEPTAPLMLSWCVETVIHAQNTRAFELAVPEQITESEKAALVAAGITVVSHVSIRPVGLVASAWDGEGEAEWLVGEPAIIGIRSDLLPQRCHIIVDGVPYFLEWTHGESELLFSLDGLSVGTHELLVTLLGANDRQLAGGRLVATIRDPQVRPEGATVGEGIRMLASPARPTLSELWDSRADLVIEGPYGVAADLHVTLLDRAEKSLKELSRPIRLPVDEKSWLTTVKSIRADRHFRDAYDETESCVVTVSLGGVGFAALTCDRGFQPLRWTFKRSSDGQVVADVIDRTDGSSTSVELFEVTAPLAANPQPAAYPFHVPPSGGLAIAKAGEVVAAVILPSNPNALIGLRQTPRLASVSERSPVQVLSLIHAHRQWMSAELPADIFAVHQQSVVGEVIAGAIGSLIGGNHWMHIESRVAATADLIDLVEDMQDSVGNSHSNIAISARIALKFFEWTTPEKLLLGFNEIMAPYLPDFGIKGKPSAPRFMLLLASRRPGVLGDWESKEAEFLIDCILKSPVLYRAARFAVLGTRAFNDADSAEQGF